MVEKTLGEVFDGVHDAKITRAIEWAERMSKKATKPFKQIVYEHVFKYWIDFGNVQKININQR